VKKTSEYLQDIKEKAKGFFKKKEPEPIIEIPTSWRKERQTNPIPSAKPVKVPRIHPVQIPSLRKFKVVLVLSLLVLNIILGIVSFVVVAPNILGILFFLNAIIFLDYVWEIRGRKI